MKQYEVGSILYLIPESNFMSIPVQVVEEVIRKSISGETIDHYVQIPNKEERVLLRDIKADIFQDLEEVKTHLLELATRKVEKIISQTEELTLQNFEVVVKKSNSTKKNNRRSKKKSGALKSNQIELGNGQKANIVMSDEIREILS